MHAIEKDRNLRFQNMTEFLAAIENPDAHYRAWLGLPAPSAVDVAFGRHHDAARGWRAHADRARDSARRPASSRGRRRRRARRRRRCRAPRPRPTAAKRRSKSSAPLFAAIGGASRSPGHRRGGDGAEERAVVARVAAAGGIGAERGVRHRHGQERSAGRQSHAWRQRPDWHDSVADEGEEGRPSRSTCW